MSMNTATQLTDREKIELIRKRLEWINVHGMMFELTFAMKMEREMLKEELEELESKMTEKGGK